MRGLVDWLAAHVEPYVSFRFLLTLIFTGMFVQWVAASWLWIRDVTRSRAGATERDLRLARIAKSYALILLLRSLSWRNLRVNFGLIVQIMVLLAATAALGVAIYAGA